MKNNYKIEKTNIEEKETFIHIDNHYKTVELTTSDYKVYNRLKKKLGEAHQVFPNTIPENKNNPLYISGASWKYNYFTKREELKQIFSITNLLPRKKEDEDIEKDNNE